jgi:DNA-binding response OmpR family regulator
MLLIVDHDPAFLNQAERFLNTGRGVFIARDAVQAKELIGSVGAAVSVVLVDLDLPGQDGFSLIRELCEHFPDLPVIAMSGVFQGHALESARLVGATDTLAKPITGEWNTAIARARLGPLPDRIPVRRVRRKKRAS